MTDLYPMLVQPRYVERIWGGHSLADRLGLPAPRDRAIGEAWEIYEENSIANGPNAGCTIGRLRGVMGRELTGQVDPEELFPLLTKLIDAQEVLSVQVHPDDAFARRVEHQPYGKTECWYVIDAAPGATLTYGFNRDTGPDEYERLVDEGELDEVLRSIPVKAGDVVYLPAGMVHAIGAGVILFELQQTSDVTYRIYDWNRVDATGKPRELHVEKARKVLDYHRAVRGPVHTLHQSGDRRAMLIAGRYFCLELIEAGVGELETHRSPVAVCALDRPLRVRAGSSRPVTLGSYLSLLVPAAAERYSLEPSDGDGGRALAAYVPASPHATQQDLLSRGYGEEEVDMFLAQFAPARHLGEPATGRLG